MLDILLDKRGLWITYFLFIVSLLDWVSGQSVFNEISLKLYSLKLITRQINEALRNKSSLQKTSPFSSSNSPWLTAQTTLHIPAFKYCLNNYYILIKKGALLEVPI